MSTSPLRASRGGGKAEPPPRAAEPAALPPQNTQFHPKTLLFPAGTLRLLLPRGGGGRYLCVCVCVSPRRPPVPPHPTPR